MIDYLPKCATITGFFYYAAIMPKLREVNEKRRGKLKKGVLLHQDNVLLHRALVSIAASYNAGLELVEHSPYSIYLAPSDHRQFPTIKERLSGKKVSHDIEVLCCVDNWFAGVKYSSTRQKNRWLKWAQVQEGHVEKKG